MSSTPNTSNEAKKPLTKKKYKKAPTAPKRFKSSYVLFFMHHQKSILESLKSHSVPREHAKTGAAITKICSKMWKALSDEERQYWRKKSEEDLERYKREKASYNGPWIVLDSDKKKRFKKDPTAPKKNPSAFLLYTKDRRREVRKDNPGMTNADVSRILGKEWKEMPEKEKAPFIAQEKIDRMDYHERKARWKSQKKKDAANAPSDPASPSVTPAENEKNSQQKEHSLSPLYPADTNDLLQYNILLTGPNFRQGVQIPAVSQPRDFYGYYLSNPSGPYNSSMVNNVQQIPRINFNLSGPTPSGFSLHQMRDIQMIGQSNKFGSNPSFCSQNSSTTADQNQSDGSPVPESCPSTVLNPSSNVQQVSQQQLPLKNQVPQNCTSLYHNELTGCGMTRTCSQSDETKKCPSPASSGEEEGQEEEEDEEEINFSEFPEVF